jgi:hypothetical protein
MGKLSLIVNFGMENMIMASNLPISLTAPLWGTVCHRTTPTVIGQLRSLLGQLWPLLENSDLHRTTPTVVGHSNLCCPTNPGVYAMMSQNTTTEATDTKMDHVNVISINLPISWTAPLNITKIRICWLIKCPKLHTWDSLGILSAHEASRGGHQLFQKEWSVDLWL